jgi:hypothetical protein
LPGTYRQQQKYFCAFEQVVLKARIVLYLCPDIRLEELILET